MTRIEILPHLEIGFPGRCAAFREGVAIGALAAKLAAGGDVCEALLPRDAGEQATALAEAMGYRVLAADAEGDGIRLRLLKRGLRPPLKIVRR